ncbi:MAG TPA: hypothetical protein VGF60_23970 [Xanthobacteraceae bacterium]|jgi:hypothetical protein
MGLALLIILYVVLCLLTGYLGRYRRMGYTGTVLLSLLITPVLMVLILALFGPSHRVEWRRKPEK